MPNTPSKTSKTGYFGVLKSKSSDCCLNCEKITQSDCQEEEKRMPNYMCYQSLLLMTIFFQYENYQKLPGKTEKYPPTCFGTGHMTVLSTPPWKTG